MRQAAKKTLLTAIRLLRDLLRLIYENVRILRQAVHQRHRVTVEIINIAVHSVYRTELRELFLQRGYFALYPGIRLRLK